MIHLDGALRTDEMDFAAYLVIAGYNLAMSEVRRGKVEWVLDESVIEEMSDGAYEDLEEHVRCYNAGEARVEPRQFYETCRTVRQDLYALLKHQAVRVAQPSRAHGSQ